MGFKECAFLGVVVALADPSAEIDTFRIFGADCGNCFDNRIFSHYFLGPPRSAFSCYCGGSGPKLGIGLLILACLLTLLFCPQARMA